MKIFMIELTNVCPNNCYYCPHSIMTRTQGYMSLETVNKIIEYTDTKSLLVSNYGESILHPQLSTIINLLYDNGIKTVIDINSNTITHPLMELAMSLPFIRINISVDLNTNDGIIKDFMDDRVCINAFGRDRASVLAIREVWGDNIHLKYMRNFFNKLNFDSELYPFREECELTRDNVGAVLWNGDLCACPYDYDNKSNMGTIDNVNNVTNIGFEGCRECLEYVNNYNSR